MTDDLYVYADSRSMATGSEEREWGRLRERRTDRKISRESTSPILFHVREFVFP